MDVSFHPVDVEWIQRELLPFITGKRRSIDPLVDRAVELAKVRFRANAFGGGLFELVDATFDEPRKQKKAAKKKAAKKKAAKKAPAVPATFDPELHMWGRPFLVVAEAPGEVSAAVDRYLEATPDDVDAVVDENVRRLSPALVGKVEASCDGELPPDDELVRELRWKLDLFRDGFARLKAGEKTIEHQGDELELRPLFERDLLLTVVSFASTFMPGWMCRGHAWPTLLFPGAKKLFESPAPIVAPVLAGLGLKPRLRATITENYMVGGYVPAAKVPELAKFVAGDGLLEALAREGWMEPDLQVAARKLREAVADAARRKVAFAEATEVYSAPMGILN